MPKEKKDGRVYLSKGISVEPMLFDAAMKRATELRMSWSEYVRRCMESDLASGGDMKISSRNPKRKPGEF
jgi:hypothetical protein